MRIDALGSNGTPGRAGSPADQQNVLLESEANAVELQTGLFQAAARMVGGISPD